MATNVSQHASSSTASGGAAPGPGNTAPTNSSSAPVTSTNATMTRAAAAAAAAATAAAIPRVYRSMKVPFTLGRFDGKNVSEYMRNYNLIADDYSLTGRTKLSRFTAYCSIEIIPEIEA